MLSSEEFANRLLTWHQRAGRKDLPWQQHPTAYRVWVSEIMLQQTQVATVIPYFNRFIARFPDATSLADTALDELLHLWSGLGYYARARNMHRAAQQIRDRHQGRFPEAYEQVVALPGIGRSTAGAVLSLSLGRRYPILDGNVKRVLTRFFAVPGWPGQVAVQNRLWAAAEQLTSLPHPGTYNQAIMDLGAGVCTRTRPACSQCPLIDHCRAYAEGDPTRYPESRAHKKLRLKSVRMLLLHRDRESLLLEQRPPSGIWGGLWSLPECGLENDPEAYCEKQLGVRVDALHELPSRRHTFTHFHLDIHPLVLQVKNYKECVMDGSRRVWYNTANPDRLGLAAPVARLIDEFSRITTGD